LIFVYCNNNSKRMIQAKAFRLFLLLMGSHGDVLGSSVEADGNKKKASAVQQDLLLDDKATPSLKRGPPWPDFDGASAVNSGPGPPNLFVSEDKEEHLLLDEEATPFTNEDLPWPDFDGASAIYSGPAAAAGALESAEEEETSEEEASEEALEVVKHHQKKMSSVLHDEEAVMPSKQKREDSWPHVDDASLINSGRGSDKEVMVRDVLFLFVHDGRFGWHLSIQIKPRMNSRTDATRPHAAGGKQMAVRLLTHSDLDNVDS
jgi:hypothetical protein